MKEGPSLAVVLEIDSFCQVFDKGLASLISSSEGRPIT